MRAIEQGQLKIRVRSIENERALTRLGTQSRATTALLLSSLCVNVASAARLGALASAGVYAAAGVSAFMGASALMSLSVFDKKAAKYESKDFNEA